MQMIYIYVFTEQTNTYAELRYISNAENLFSKTCGIDVCANTEKYRGFICLSITYLRNILLIACKQYHDYGKQSIQIVINSFAVRSVRA